MTLENELKDILKDILWCLEYTEETDSGKTVRGMELFSYRIHVIQLWCQAIERARKAVNDGS